MWLWLSAPANLKKNRLRSHPKNIGSAKLLRANLVLVKIIEIFQFKNSILPLFRTCPRLGWWSMGLQYPRRWSQRVVQGWWGLREVWVRGRQLRAWR